MPDLIFVSMEDWDQVWRRNQFICAEYVRRHPGVRVLFVGLVRDVSSQLRSGRVSGLWKPRSYPAPGFDNIRVFHPLKWLPNSSAAGRAINERVMRVGIRRASAEFGIRRPLLWMNAHSAVHLVGQVGERVVIYDVTDDWTALTQSARETQLVKNQDAELCGRADAVVVCSPRLYEMKSPISRRVELIPNGVEAGRYVRVLDGRDPLPAPSAKWKRPVLGYTGTVHPDRIDLNLVADIARRWRGSIVLVGPNHLSPDDRARLDLPNVCMHEAVPFDSIPDYMRAFDVCIVPHLVSPFTESLNPIKLWEYLAAGKPIVSTPVAGFRDFPQHIYLETDAGAFISAAERGMKEDSGVREARRQEVKKHSWQKRVDAIDSLIAESLVRPSKPKRTGVVEIDNKEVLLSVIIVSFNTCKLTLECLRAIYDDLREASSEVWVVDNGSTDGSAKAIRDAFQKVRLIENAANRGFGVANNQAMRLSRGRYLLLLNSDAFVSRGTCGTLVDYLEQRPEIAVAGPRLLNADGSLQPSCFPFPSPGRAWVENLAASFLFRGHKTLEDFRRWPHDRERRVPWVVGACLLVRRNVYLEIGGFDEQFFMYAEETDWQQRIRRAGWEIGFVPKAVVTHFGGASGASTRESTRMAFFESLDRFLLKHYGRVGWIVARAAMIIGCCARALTWTCIAWLRPSQRKFAEQKARMHVWLAVRQATCAMPKSI